MLTAKDLEYDSGRALPQSIITFLSDQIEADIAKIVKPKRKDTPTNQGTVDLGKEVRMSYNIEENRIKLFVGTEKKSRKRLKKVLEKDLGKGNVDLGEYKAKIEAIYPR